MRVLVDISHPAHVHLFRHAIEQLRDDGHEVGVVSREKDVTTDLLDAYDVSHVPISRKRSGAAALPREWLWRELRLLRTARSFDPDVIVSRLNPAAAHVGHLLDVPNVVFHDTEAAGLVDRVTTPFATVVCTPEEFDRDVGETQQRYAGFHELAYLHPARFEADPDRLREAGVEPDDPYAVVRLVGMDAHHDAGKHGLSESAVRSLVDGLGTRGDVYVTSEQPLPSDLAAHEPPVAPHEMHQLLAFADVYVGDSATMATEAGILGTPTVRYDPLGAGMGNFAALAEYGLVVSTDDEDEAVDRAIALAADGGASTRWRRRRRELLADKIDVTAYLTEVVTEVGDS
jgi:hypothetical protein